MTPVLVDDRLVTGWMDALGRPAAGTIPSGLIQRWRADLLAAVQEAREPVPTSLTGRYAPLDRYLTGIAAGLAAGLGKSPASDAGDSDPIILSAGFLAGSAALHATPGIFDYEVWAGRAAAAAMVDSAANGAGLVVVIQAASRAAVQVRARTMVGIALEALLRSVSTGYDEDHPRFDYEVRLLLEPFNPRDELDEVTLDRALGEICDDRRWIPDETGYRLVLVTALPGALIETVWSFGRVRDLSVRYLPD